jgi:4-aminobutyrate aminotransferase-like enzyme
MTRFDEALREAAAFLERARLLNQRYREGGIHVHVPEALRDGERPLEEILPEALPRSSARLQAASQSLFYSLPLAFDPGESVGPYLATVDRDPQGEPYRFLDMGALLATHAFGENDPAMVEAVLREIPFAVERYAHSEYQTTLSLRLKARLSSIAPPGTPRHFVVNTGAEAVENAMKSVLLNRVRTSREGESGFFIISFEGAFHGRTLGCLAVTQRKKARLGFPTFDWPHVPFPLEDPRAPEETLRREEQSLRQIWELLVTGRLVNVPRSRDAFRSDLDLIDRILAGPSSDVPARIEEARAQIARSHPDALRRAHRVAGVLVEPIQGEGGVRVAPARFFRRLRLLTRLYEVPLLFDEVQTGWGATGVLWAHELFDLPLPPDVVIWAKKAQNGVLFVSEELAGFFQEEKKFNTTWEGDSLGMVRLLSSLDKLDLAQVRRTGALAREELDRLARDYGDFVHGVRGAGCMLGFDVARADWRDSLRDRAFRRGLILLPAGERTLRFYPRYDMEPCALNEAAAILRSAVEDILRGDGGESVVVGPERRLGTFEVPPGRIEILDLRLETFDALRSEVMAVERERYGSIAQYPPEVLRQGRRPLLQYPESALEATLGHARSLGLALRDSTTGRIIAYALGSPLENHDEVGVADDPHFGEGTTFYLQAMATHPSVANATAVEVLLLNALRERALAAGFENLSTLIEARVCETGPSWLKEAREIRVLDDYLGSGMRFAYLQVKIASSSRGAPG